MSLSDYDRANVGAILAGQGDWFSAHLLRLIRKADTVNLVKLQLVFPEHVEAYREYMNGEVSRDSDEA